MNLIKAQKVENYNTQRPALIYENKGQVVDQNRNVRNDVRMIFSAPGFTLAIKDKGMSYELVSSKTYQKQAKNKMLGMDSMNPKTQHLNDSVVFESHRIDIDFVNANPNPTIIKEGQSKYYENYYTEYTGEEGVTNIYGYTKTILKDVWKNIDIEFIADGKTANSFKYNFIIRAGGNINDIQLKYNGTTPVLLDNAIKITSSFGEISETIPAVYYTTHTSEKPEVNYILKDNIISFEGKNINTDYNTLVIDPSLVWGTYYGQMNFDGGAGITTFKVKSVYLTGHTGSSSNIATSGAFQTSVGGNYDAFLAHFSSDGSRKWATYIGGSGLEWGNGICVSDSQNIYVTGETFSTSGIASSNAFQKSNAGARDGFFAKFSKSGSRLWSTYFGGSDDDHGCGISVNHAEEICLTGYTSSDSGITTSASHQTSFGGSYDGFVAKFSSSCSIIWSTYYGGGNTDYIYASTIDDSSNIYITGVTSSGSNIATSNMYQTSFAGFFDAFLAKFSDSGNLIWGTYFGGSSAEMGLCIDHDSVGDIYFAGCTESKKGIASSGAYQTTHGGGQWDVFIVKFSDSGTYMWSTYYGGKNSDVCRGISGDSMGNVYLAGYTQSPNAISTKGAYKTTIGGGGLQDVFVARFSSLGTRKWATYYGGDDNDDAYAIKTDGIGNIYITGESMSTTGIATGGSHQTSHVGNTDIIVAKFSFNPNNDVALTSIISPRDTICAGLDSIIVSLKNIDIDTLFYDSIYWSINGTPQTPILWKGKLIKDSSIAVYLGTYTFNTSGISTIKIISTNPNGKLDSISWNDTAAKKITVIALPTTNAGNNSTICRGKTTIIGSSSIAKMHYSWSSTLNTYKSNIANPKVKPSNTTSYYLAVTDSISGCIGYDTVTIKVNPFSILNINTNICAGAVYNFSGKNISAAGIYYDTLTNSVGCDSIIVLTLNVLKQNSYTIYVNICKGQSYSFSGNNLSNAGIYYDTLMNYLGCDSIIILNLNILSNSSSLINANICQGDYYIFRTTKIFNTGIYYDTLKSSIGCDSIVTLNLSVLPTSSSTIKAYICPNGYYSFRGKPIFNSGTYYDTLKNTIGCDSVVTLVLTMGSFSNPLIKGSPTSFCDGDSVILSTTKFKSYLWNTNDTTQSIIVKTSGNYIVKVTDSNGCPDSSNSIKVTVYSNPTPVITKINNSLQTGNYKTYQWYLNSSIITNANSQIYTPTVNGNYTVYVTDTNGCSGISSIYNVGWTGISVYENNETIIYPNPTNGEVIMDFPSASSRTLYIYDAWGRKVFDTKFLDRTYKVSLNENYGSGIYFFVLVQGEDYRIYKIVKN